MASRKGQIFLAGFLTVVHFAPCGLPLFQLGFCLGSLLAISMLSMRLGRVFEPFVIQAIPYLLQSIGDGNIHIRQVRQERISIRNPEHFSLH